MTYLFSLFIANLFIPLIPNFLEAQTLKRVIIFLPWEKKFPFHHNFVQVKRTDGKRWKKVPSALSVSVFFILYVKKKS